MPLDNPFHWNLIEGISAGRSPAQFNIREHASPLDKELAPLWKQLSPLDMAPGCGEVWQENAEKKENTPALPSGVPQDKALQRPLELQQFFPQLWWGQEPE